MDQSLSQPESILFVIFQLGIGGAEGQMRNLVEYLVNRGKQISVFSLCKNTLEIDIQKIPNVPVRFGNRKNPYDPLPVFQIARFIKQIKPSTIVCFDRHSWLYCLAARKLSGEKIPIIARSMETRGLITWRAEIQLKIAKLLSFHNDRIVALSEALKSQLIKRWKFQEEKIKLITIGVDTEKYSYATILQFTGMRESMGIPEESHVIVQIGNLSENKNQDFSIGLLLELIMKEKIDGYLVLVGGGSRRRWKELHLLANSAGISERVIFAGVHEDVRPYLAMADFLLLSSKAEATPNVILESLACGIPVLVSKYDSAEEQLSADLKEWIVPLENREEFFKKAVKLLQNAELRKSIGKIGSCHVQNHFTIDSSNQRWEALISETMGQQI